MYESDKLLSGQNFSNWRGSFEIQQIMSNHIFNIVPNSVWNAL